MDIEELIKKGSRADVEVVDRKAALSGDLVSKLDVIRDTYIEMSNRKKCKYDMVIDLDITSPLRTIEDLVNLVEKKKNAECDVVFSVTGARRNPYFNMVIKGENGYGRVMVSDFTARQQAPEIYDMNASMYAYTTQFLDSGRSMFEGKCEIIKMYDTGILDLDYEDDFELMQVIAQHLFDKHRTFKEVKDNIFE